MVKDRFKFRVWDKKQKKFHYFEIGYLFFETDKCEQCTGLKDKNEKLIYEGDILEDFHGNKYKVVWGFNCYLIKNNDCDHLLTDPDYFGVIGNIHENPDLLKK